MTTTDHDPATLYPIGTILPTGAKITGHLHFSAATDNRRTTAQTIVNGVAEVFTYPDGNDGWHGHDLRIPGGLDLFGKHATNARFLVDTGTDESVPGAVPSLTLYWSGSFNSTHRFIGLRRMTPNTHPYYEDYGPRPLLHLMVYRTVTEESAT